MPVPILKQGEVLIASIQSNLDDQDLMQLRDDIAEKVGRFKSHGVVLDESVLAVMDSFATRTMRTIAETARLRSAVQRGSRRGVLVIARDQGPGIPDIERAMRDGYSTGKSLGLGLPGAKRLMDEFEIISEIGKGTTITMRKWAR